jgi:hypothetical protein
MTPMKLVRIAMDKYGVYGFELEALDFEVEPAGGELLVGVTGVVLVEEVRTLSRICISPLLVLMSSVSTLGSRRSWCLGHTGR